MDGIRAAMAPKTGMRMGNYALLAFAGGNIAREFIYGGPHTLFGRTDRSAVSGNELGSQLEPLSHSYELQRQRSLAAGSARTRRKPRH